MENQQNQANQDSQQNYQGPTQSPNPTSAKSRPNYWMITNLVMVIILILVGIYSVKQAREQSSRSEFTTVTPSPMTAQQVATYKPEPSPTSIDQQLKSYDGKYISLSYLPHWYVWHYERTVKELDFFQLNSITRADQANPNHVNISIEIQNSPFQTLDDEKKQYPDKDNSFTERKIDGLNARVYKSDNVSDFGYSNYQTRILVIKNNVKYTIRTFIGGRTKTVLDYLANQYNPEFENILNTIKLK